MAQSGSMEALNAQPQAVEAEQAVLGAMLSSKEAVSKVIGILSGDHFYRDAHAKIFSTMTTLFHENIPIDTISIIDQLKKSGNFKRTIVIVASGEDAPGLQFIAPYAATTMAEFFMKRGEDVLIVYDDLTRHARAYRELSLLLRRPPGREAYPGDIFYIHSRLLERAARLSERRGGGSLTALPIAETQAQNISAYIPTNLISITDGQIYLSPELFSKGVLPAVDIGLSVSRVGGDAQRRAYRAVASDLKLYYAQYEELEIFSRFSARLDDETRSRLERGRRIREVLKQGAYERIAVPEQIAILLSATDRKSVV